MKPGDRLRSSVLPGFELPVETALSPPTPEGVAREELWQLLRAQQEALEARRQTEAERRRAETERQRAEAAEARARRLTDRLRELGLEANGS